MSQPTSQQAVVIAGLLADYTSAALKSTPSSIDLVNATMSLSTAFGYLVSSPDPSSLTTMWDFFILYQNSILQENVALAGVGSLSPSNRFRYMILYSLFRQATSGLTIATTDTMVDLLLDSPFIVEYLQKMAKSVQLPNQTMEPLATKEYVAEQFLPANLTPAFLSWFASLPTTLPSAPNQAWNNGGTFAVTPTG